MSRRVTKHPDCIPPLVRAGFTTEDAYALRRCAMTLHRWYELECGASDGAVERDETTGKTFWIYPSGRRIPCNDRETPALARVAKIMARYPELTVFHQTDPRGAPLYVLRPGDVPPGENPDAWYSRGLAVYK